MTDACTFDSLSFHEATVLGVAAKPAAFEVELEVATGSEKLKSIVLDFHSVQSLTRDDVPVGAFEMEQPDGEVLTLRRKADEFLMIVEWNDFNAGARHTSAWRWTGDVTMRDPDRV